MTELKGYECDYCHTKISNTPWYWIENNKGIRTKIMNFFLTKEKVYDDLHFCDWNCVYKYASKLYHHKDNDK